MVYPRKRTEGQRKPGGFQNGLGVPCPEAQADGVPCLELIDCAECDWRKLSDLHTTPSAAPTDTPANNCDA